MWWRYDEVPWQVWPNNRSTGRYPSTWDIEATSHRLVEVSRYQHQDEYEKIQILFSKTLPEGNITKLERVQNYKCWDTYARQREVMINKNCFVELQLFHGTEEESIDDICRENFDFRLSGIRVGAIYGQGTYFARKASYSNNYAKADAHNIKKMFVARVLVGSYTRGTENMRRPPYKDPSDKTKGFYDSCVDNTSDPNIFVVFDNHQVYPEYLITYSTSGKQIPRNVQIFPGSGKHQSSNQFNPLSSSQSRRSVVGANQAMHSSSNQQSSNPSSAQSPHSNANQQSPNIWPSIQSIRNALMKINNYSNDTFTHMQVFLLFLLFIISISALFSYTPSSIVLKYLLFCLLTSALFLHKMNDWPVSRIMIIVIISFLLSLSLVLQLFTYGLQIFLSFSYNNFAIYILFSIFISAMVYANEMKIDVKSACKWVLLSELLIVLLLPVIPLFLYLFILLTSSCYNNFGIFYIMISMMIFTILYTNKNMVFEYKCKWGLISELVMLLMLPVLPVFLDILRMILLCCYNKFVVCIYLLLLILITAVTYEDKMKIKDRYVCKWVLTSELLILLLLPILQLFLYLLQILVYFFLVLFLLASILIPTMILNILCM